MDARFENHGDPGRRVLYPKEAVLGFMRANLRECKEASA